LLAYLQAQRHGSAMKGSAIRARAKASGAIGSCSTGSKRGAFGSDAVPQVSLHTLAEQLRGSQSNVLPPPTKKAKASDGGRQTLHKVASDPADSQKVTSLDHGQLMALNKALETIGTLQRRLAVLQLPGLISRCVEVLPAKASLHKPPRSRAGSSLLNERVESRTTIQLLLEAVREFEKTQASPPSTHHGLCNDAAGKLLPLTISESDVRTRRNQERLRGLLDRFEVLRAEQQCRISRDNADAITLCSIHGSKGLEWPHVFVPRLNEGELPLASSTDAALEEERRLAYVALSRAKERLYLSYIMVEPSGQPATPSRFTGEIPAELVERSSAGFD
jgi:superfamily I DNA/RNA helicase